MYREKKQGALVVLLIVVSVCVNLAGSSIAGLFQISLYLDSIGTVIGSVLGGYLPGIIIGLVTNGIKALSDPASVYYASLSVILAVVSAHLGKRDWFKKPAGILGLIVILAAIGGGIGSVFTWFIYGFAAEGISVPFVQALYKDGHLTPFAAQFLADFLLDLLDKAITVLAAAVFLRLFPAKYQDAFWMHAWRQTPLDAETERKVQRRKTRKRSMRTKLLVLVVSAMALIALLATGISARLYMDNSIADHTRIGTGVAALAAYTIPGDRVTEFLEKGEAAEGYDQIEERLYAIRDTSRDILYIYAYRIEEDGCHVVFDLDTEELEGAAPGDLIEFDESFAEYIPTLLAGEEIEPLVTDDTYGWLLTAYCPVYDSDGNCVCYAAADIDMGGIRMAAVAYVAKMLSLFLGFFILVMISVMWFSTYNIILPVNTMSEAASTFVVGSEESRKASVAQIKALNIRTGDEIEELYQSFSRTTSDCIEYAEQIRKNTEMIKEMQNGLISVLAEVVESRDKCTGDHIRKTALYAKLIMEEMVKEGIYKDQMTDEFIEEVYYSAPLHDVGKIQVPDAILNKPGKLTEEEFRIMKTHTTAGNEIIEHAIAIVPDPMYLKETQSLSMYHHEKWNGTGYPTGLKGEEIPLSARIMAVADVFDALVSERSYKKGMPFDVAFHIIEEGVGTHFDPLIARAFLNCREEAEKIAKFQARRGQPEKKPEEQNSEEQKPEEQKPEEQKPEEQKPEEQKPENQKPEVQ